MVKKVPEKELRRQWNLYVKSNLIEEYIKECELISISPHRRIEKFIKSDIDVLHKLKVKMGNIEHKWN